MRLVVIESYIINREIIEILDFRIYPESGCGERFTLYKLLYNRDMSVIDMSISNNMDKFTDFHIAYLRKHMKKNAVLNYIPIVCGKNILTSLIENTIKNKLAVLVHLIGRYFVLLNDAPCQTVYKQLGGFLVGAVADQHIQLLAGEVQHGVFIMYFVNAITSFTMFFLYKKSNIHPFRLTPILVGLGGLGFLLMFVATQVSALSYIACALIGIGVVPCQMLPLYGSVIMKSYPSKYISPIIIFLALVAVLVQSSMVEMFRNAPVMLYLVYAVIMTVLVFIYAQIEPFLLFSLRRRNAENNETAQKDISPVSETVTKPAQTPAETPDILSVLTPKEREVAEFICMGYTNKDIAKIMFISENTVKDHTKKIYPKMGVHSRFELATLVSKNRSEDN